MKYEDWQIGQGWHNGEGEASEKGCIAVILFLFLIKEWKNMICFIVFFIQLTNLQYFKIHKYFYL